MKKKLILIITHLFISFIHAMTLFQINDTNLPPHIAEELKKVAASYERITQTPNTTHILKELNESLSAMGYFSAKCSSIEKNENTTTIDCQLGPATTIETITIHTDGIDADWIKNLAHEIINKNT